MHYSLTFSTRSGERMMIIWIFLLRKKTREILIFRFFRLFAEVKLVEIKITFKERGISGILERNDRVG